MNCSYHNWLNSVSNICSDQFLRGYDFSNEVIKTSCSDTHRGYTQDEGFPHITIILFVKLKQKNSVC